MRYDIMIKGQRARNDCGSPDDDRSQRWGALVTGVSQSALRAYRMWCPDDSSGTDRSSSELWLEHSLRPDPGSGCNRRPMLITEARAPPGTPLDRFENHKGLDKSPHRSSHPISPTYASASSGSDFYAAKNSANGCLRIRWWFLSIFRAETEKSVPNSACRRPLETRIKPSFHEMFGTAVWDRSAARFARSGRLRTGPRSATC